MSEISVLVIDDEPQIRKLLEIGLGESGCKVYQAATAKEGLLLAANYSPDLILLDLGLPDISGQHLLKQLRQWYNKAIIILSVQHEETEIITALDNGATDYLTKPFRMGELSARIRSAIRRNNMSEETVKVIADNLEIDLVARTVKYKNELLKFTATEYNLLALLAKNQGRVLTHQYILREVWGVGYQRETQYLRVFIAQIRKKMEENPNEPQHIITESGVGYRFQ